MPKPRPARSRNFTGIDAPYEAPEAPEIHLLTAGQEPEQLAERVIRNLAERAIIGRQ